MPRALKILIIGMFINVTGASFFVAAEYDLYS